MIIPTYNESANIALLVEKLFTAVPGIHVLVVDDQSPDGTADICEKLGERYPALHLLRRDGPPGLGRAYVAGMQIALDAGYDVIGTMDADLSHNPEYLPAMLDVLGKADVVIGSRYIRDGGTVNWPLRRMVLSWMANRFAATLLRVPAHDLTSGYRVYRRRALEAVQPGAVHSTGYSFLVELLYRAFKSGARLAESPIIFYDRTSGVSKLHKREIYRGMFSLFRLRFGGYAWNPNAVAAEQERATAGGVHSPAVSHESLMALLRNVNKRATTASVPVLSNASSETAAK